MAVDIGSSAVKLMALDAVGGKLKLKSAGIAPTPPGSLANNAVSLPEQVGEAIRRVIEANDIKAPRAAFAIPGPAVFTKRITVAQCSIDDLEDNIGFEASNYIPHAIDAVHLDYQVLKVNENRSMEVLLVAVKNEIIESYVRAIEFAGLMPSIADVDYFALENMFGINYPEHKDKTIALLNIGARFTSVSIIQNGQSLFTGDVGVGGRLYTDALCEALNMPSAEAEKIKAGLKINKYDENLISEALERTTDHISSELHRQLGFFWNAAATDKSIEAIFVGGGASQIAGLVEEIGVRTGMVCQLVDPLRALTGSDNFDREFIEKIRLSMGVSIGLAIRRFGDKCNAVK